MVDVKGNYLRVSGNYVVEKAVIEFVSMIEVNANLLELQVGQQMQVSVLNFLNCALPCLAC
eukprot:1421549-Pleurochrysis_carterae.AAC.3